MNENEYQQVKEAVSTIRTILTKLMMYAKEMRTTDVEYRTQYIADLLDVLHRKVDQIRPAFIVDD